MDLVSKFADDLALAEDLQVQEVLQYSTRLERVCAVCKQVFLSSEASWQPDNCDHAICIACFCQYAEELPRCMVATCEYSRVSQAQQGIDVFHDALTSLQDMDGSKGKEPCDDMLREFGQYIASKVEENVLSIGCPDPGCKDGTLQPEECRDVIPLKVFQRWGAALCDSALGALKFYCPFKDCSAMLIDDHGHGEAAITDAKCPHCSRLFCAQCKVAWHDGVTCAEFQQLGNDERGKDDLLLRKVAKNKKWQRCPKCQMYVERVDGCVYIVCRCRYCFCYLCGSPMTKGDHRCSKCKRTW
ncbi:hypothetical protein QOZ80_6BG0488560 [Eleusine coracana subsp. coracana]|nr:hypothetical protein QOZ80_6BG0488560 [Eleusine coracana subsp. coracana]